MHPSALTRRAFTSGLGLLAALPVGAETPLRIAIDINDQGGLTPVARAIIGRAFERVGVALHFEPLPLRRSLRMSSSGEIDGEALRTAALADEHPELLKVPTAIAILEVHLFARPGFPEALPRRIQDMRPWRIARQRGVVLLEQLLAKHPLQLEVQTQGDMLQALRHGQADLGLLTMAAGRGRPAAAQLDGVLHGPEPLLRLPLYLLLHQRHRVLAGELNAELQAMEAGGEAARLREQVLVRLPPLAIP
ncbi:transporter substrate-binding domain-containing protein [Pelomonas sp. SE-A7]|uniref:transporter substrate-binding domain-containing protein n=1 Tax=Pelomonas sp. SE-A7 TaxID=3054953 RepID=UPI00259CC6F7|nr:transporter substrate-binding domain-containing protein [Pelomonas sp. SE-A7]MDM4768025.1 transporter substrate-binding domain-containing protein [Pelomonas sp. SE-A7]